jgi:ABC-type amino acid transport substrate-binding protein
LSIIRTISWGLLLGLLYLTPLNAASPAGEHITLQTERIVWKGDLDSMIKRRIVRVLLPYNKTLYFLDEDGQQRGLMYDMMMAFEQELNKQSATKHLKIQFIFLPTPRDRLIPELLAGKGDIIAADFTVTPERQKLIDFSTPLASGVKEVIVTSANGPKLNSLEDLSGKVVFVNPSTSYAENLKILSADLVKQKKRPSFLKMRLVHLKRKIYWKWQMPILFRLLQAIYI